MPKLRLVIDASVAGRAGETQHPVSKANRLFLIRARRVCHKIVMSPPIRNEWDRHQSLFSKTWFASMESKKKVVTVRPRVNPNLRDAVEASEGREAMRKDVPLIEAAGMADLTVVSADNRARSLFARLSAGVSDLQAIVWVNPEEEPEELFRWLRRGVDPRPEWRLGSQ